MGHFLAIYSNNFRQLSKENIFSMFPPPSQAFPHRGKELFLSLKVVTTKFPLPVGEGAEPLGEAGEG